MILAAKIIFWIALGGLTELALGVVVGRCIGAGMGTLPLTPEPDRIHSAEHAARDRDF